MMDDLDPFELDVLLPVHNEAGSVANSLQEIFSAVSPVARMRFVISEDGSRDGTREILLRQSREFPMKLVLGESRKGYSQAMRDGMAAVAAPYLLCLDSDGQCDPGNFREFWGLRDSWDILLGWRVCRADPLLRRVLSRFFYLYYQVLFRVPVHDPSCSLMLTRRDVIERIAPKTVEMREGFGWEFIARARCCGYSISELPIRHRARAGGVTRIYRLGKMPGIGYRHLRALLKLWLQLKGGR